MGKMAKFIFKMGARMTAKFADQLIFDAREIERRWITDFERSGCFIPYGGDELPPLPVESGLTHRGYVLLVARFVPENTVPEFVSAASEIARHIPVVMVGSSGYGGEIDESVRSLAEEHDNIYWLGHISDDRRLYSLWQHAAVYFHGHSVGGTNPTLVQAMAAGAPIVARDTPYNREVLPPNAVFFEPSQDSITGEVLKIATDAKAQSSLSQANLRRAQSSYTWATVCAEYEREITQQAFQSRNQKTSLRKTFA